MLNRELEQRVEERTEQLRQSENQFRTLANSIPQLAWMADAKGSIFWYNQRWYDFIGARRGDAEGWGWTQCPASRSRRSGSWNLEQLLEYRRVVGRYLSFARQRRTIPAGSFRARCRIRDSQGRCCRWFGTSTDISDQIAAEEKIRHLNGQLEQRVAELETIMQVLPVGVAVAQDPHATSSPAMLRSPTLGAKLGENISLNGAGEPSSSDVYQDGKELAPRRLPIQRCAASGQQLGSMEIEIRQRTEIPFIFLPARARCAIQMARCAAQSAHSST